MSLSCARWAAGVTLAATLSGCVSEITTRSLAQAEETLAEPTGSAEPSSRDAGRDREAEPPSCDALARRVAESRPLLRASNARGRARLAEARAEAALPSAEVAVEVWDFPIGAPETADRAGMYMVSVTQTFTPLGGRDGRARALAEQSQAEALEGGELRAAAWAEVAHACVDWSVASAAIEAAQHHRELLVELREASQASYASGGTLADVARVDVELARLARAAEVATIRRDASRALVAALSGELPVPAEAPALGEPPPERASVPRTTALAAEHRERAAVARSEAALAESREPMVALRATYMQAPGERPGLGAMIGVSLPWLWGGGEDRVVAAKAEEEASRAERDEAARALTLEARKAAAAESAAAASLHALRSGELPKLDAALDAVRASSSGTSFELTTWLEALHALREAHEEEIELAGTVAHARVDAAVAVGGGR